ncbi:transcriptional regulator [Arthrobacter zhangbolii]|uniref:Transcriptional regulator n=1 Tax=Arthrobacter zhangbolii TaxID=2886936 RepID=A0A9X1M7Z2_9MICC|nr:MULTISPECIES: transcriptional regulator [Arthrobacter]MCC3272552.1 transcriptional regulator [Arthrobacter zhangbolii]MCC3293964.1 transcriptional regulator [Arthrobacter zhangbolii]MDN3903617.1 transcriptional regulator [Arthrobacter sp. YD2]UON91597.1 transcriptional regulator [Arthrobacter zhangbolii]
MPAARFDEVVHGPVRLRVCGLLSRLGSTEFALLRDTLEVSDPTLSKHLKQLEQAGYVKLSKGPGLAGRTHTWAELTVKGRAAFDSHVAFLREVISGPEGDGA